MGLNGLNKATPHSIEKKGLLKLTTEIKKFFASIHLRRKTLTVFNRKEKNYWNGDSGS